MTDDTIDALADLFSKGDVVIDGGNSNYNEAEPLADRLAKQGSASSTQGRRAACGACEGYCLMVGGTEESVAVVEPALLTLAPEGGYAHVGPVGAGHFVKMVHNGSSTG